MIMTTEDKAAAYDKAIERTRQMIEDYKNRGLDNYYACAKESLEKIFPELAESEDERIKTFIRGLILPHIADAHIADAHIVGDRIVHNKDIDNYRKALAWLEKQGEQKHIPWYDLEKSKEAGYTIVPNEEYERLIKIAEWSEEDEEHIKSLLERLEGMCKKGATFTRTRFSVLEDEDWLKSLKPQNRWKPSKDQMEAIKDAIEFLGCTKKVREDLKSLYEQMKKLREE